MNESEADRRRRIGSGLPSGEPRPPRMETGGVALTWIS